MMNETYKEPSPIVSPAYHFDFLSKLKERNTKIGATAVMMSVMAEMALRMYTEVT